MNRFIKVRKIFAFTLIELLVVIAIIAILSGILLLSLNPAQIFINARNSQRASDINTMQAAFTRYIADSSVQSTSRSLKDFTGYRELLSDAMSGNGVCANALNNGVTNNTVVGSYALDIQSSSNFINISPLINNGYLSKVLKDPISNTTPYQACIDTSNNNQLIIFSTNSEKVATPTSALITEAEGPSTNLVLNPSFEYDALNSTTVTNWNSSADAGATFSIGNDLTPISGSKELKLLENPGGSYFSTHVNQDFTVSANTTYTVSYRINIQTCLTNGQITSSIVNAGYTLNIASNAYNINCTTPSSSDIQLNAWRELSFTFNSGSNTFVHLFPLAINGFIGTVYLDAVQMELKPSYSSFIDGSRGSNYGWNGTPILSTSYRIK